MKVSTAFIMALALPLTACTNHVNSSSSLVKSNVQQQLADAGNFPKFSDAGTKTDTPVNDPYCKTPTEIENAKDSDDTLTVDEIKKSTNSFYLASGSISVREIMDDGANVYSLNGSIDGQNTFTPVSITCNSIHNDLRPISFKAPAPSSLDLPSGDGVLTEFYLASTGATKFHSSSKDTGDFFSAIPASAHYLNLTKSEGDAKDSIGGFSIFYVNTKTIQVKGKDVIVEASVFLTYGLQAPTITVN
jgi:hypothetical protein